MAGEMVSFKSNGHDAQGYLAVPASGRGKGVIVIQEYWGLVPHIKDVADRFAAAGFVALAPDLYHGKSATEPDEAGKLMMAMNIAEAERDLRGAINYLAVHPAVSGQKVGTVGFCMGGALSLFSAAHNPEKVGACVIFYGGHPSVIVDLKELAAPVLGLYAEKDHFATPESARKLEAELKAHGKSAELHIYPGVDHAFFNDTRPEVYNREASADAWQRTVEFLNKTL
jgi:carboxymethylenebutenolidase